MNELVECLKLAMQDCIRLGVGIEYGAKPRDVLRAIESLEGELKKEREVVLCAGCEFFSRWHGCSHGGNCGHQTPCGLEPVAGEHAQAVHESFGCPLGKRRKG